MNRAHPHDHRRSEAWSREVAREPRLSRAPDGALAVLVALVVAFGSLGTAMAPATGFREDEVQCEETVAHLVECCPELSAEMFACEHIPAVGCSAGHEPDFDLEQSRAIRQRSCTEIRDGDVCARARDEAERRATGLPGGDF